MPVGQAVASKSLSEWPLHGLDRRFQSDRPAARKKWHFPLQPRLPIMIYMERPSFQMSLAGLLGLVACVALNFWLFRLGALWGILGLNVTKHVAIAFLCQSLGVDRSVPPAPVRPSPAPSPQVPVS
jgi:hypothetical protein